MVGQTGEPLKGRDQHGPGMGDEQTREVRGPASHRTINLALAQPLVDILLGHSILLLCVFKLLYQTFFNISKKISEKPLGKS